MAAGAGVVIAVAAAAVHWFATSDSLRQGLERQTSAWLGEPVRIGRVSAVFFPNVSLALEDVRVGEPSRTTFAVVTLSLPLRALFSRRIEDAELTVADSRLELPLPFSLPPTGTTTGDGAGSGGIELVSLRSISLRNVTVASGTREVRISADSSLAGPRLVVDSLTAVSGATLIEASGTIDLSPRIEATITAGADILDVDDLMALAAAFGASSPGPSPAERNTARISASVSAPRGTLGGVDIGRFEATLVAEHGQLVVEPLAFDIFGGRYSGAVDAGLGPAMLLNLRGRVSNLDVSQLAEFGNAAGAIAGRLYGSGRFSAAGVDITSALTSARGIGEVVISDGAMPRLNVIQTALRFFGRPETDAPTPDGERFDEITGTFALAGGRVRSDDLRLRAPDFDIFGRGTLDLATKRLEARADLVLSEAVSAQAGRDLLRYTRAGNRVVLPATIGGTLGAPTVGIDAAAALGRGIRNEVERRLGDLFELVQP